MLGTDLAGLVGGGLSFAACRSLRASGPAKVYSFRRWLIALGFRLAAEEQGCLVSIVRLPASIRELGT